MIHAIAKASALASGLLLGHPVLADSLFNSEGYRAERYRAPLPASAPGAKTLSAQDLQALLAQQSMVLLDVQAVVVRPETADFGIGWLPSRERFNLPGSIWLPNVGYGQLNATMRRYLHRELLLASGGDVDKALVFYCVADCWMSWNAVQRAARLGYRQLYWFPGGTDSWAAQQLPLVLAQPRPLQPGPLDNKAIPQD